MNFKLPNFLKSAMDRVFGSAPDNQETAPPAIATVDREALTLAVIEEFQTKKRSGDAI